MLVGKIRLGKDKRLEEFLFSVKKRKPERKHDLSLIHWAKKGLKSQGMKKSSLN